MTLSPSKQALLEKLNQQLVNDHEEASEAAKRKGRAPPPAPSPLLEEHIEFPKWLHKGWTLDRKTGRSSPADSGLAKNAEEMKALLAEGFAEWQPEVKAAPTKDVPVKK